QSASPVGGSAASRTSAAERSLPSPGQVAYFVTAMSDLITELTAIAGAKHVLTGDRLGDYSHDGTFIQGSPVAAVLPAGTEEVRRVILACRAARMPVIPRGRGTSLVGGPVPVGAGVVLSVERLDQIEIDASAMVAIAGAGAITGEIQARAA